MLCPLLVEGAGAGGAIDQPNGRDQIVGVARQGVDPRLQLWVVAPRRAHHLDQGDTVPRQLTLEHSVQRAGWQHIGADWVDLGDVGRRVVP